MVNDDGYSRYYYATLEKEKVAPGLVGKTGETYACKTCGKYRRLFEGDALLDATTFHCRFDAVCVILCVCVMLCV